MLSKYQNIPTPALLVHQDIMMNNIEKVQKMADVVGVKLRPHTKTHKTPEIAKLQVKAGAVGIAVAKTAEAEIMVENGLRDVMIANEPVGSDKMERIAKLSQKAEITFGVDCVQHIKDADRVFANFSIPAKVMIEIEVGENRSGVVEEETLREIARAIKESKHVQLKGIFSHDGFSYKASNQDDARMCGIKAQKRTLQMAEILISEGLNPDVVSIGSTTSVLLGCTILPGITEIRIGTYVFMDASQALAVEDKNFSTCAATILLSVISKPTKKRVVFDGGAKALTMQKRTQGITENKGLGIIKDSGGETLDGMYDEHSIVNSEYINENLKVGDKVEIIPNHICPVVNLYRKMYLVSQGKMLGTYPILCSGAME